MSNSPLKRHSSLKPLSRDHHEGLLLCWKIRHGRRTGVDTDRVIRYAKWFWLNHLAPHFELEEKHVFPILGSADDLVEKAIADHRHLELLFRFEEANAEDTLHTIETDLDNHIRFEERVLFGKIQQVATPDELQTIEQAHRTPNPTPSWDDEFWNNLQ